VQGRAHLVAVHPGRDHRDAAAQRIQIAGTRAVIIGRSDIVGQADGHAAAAAGRHRHDLPLEDAGPAGRRQAADILVAAIGRAGVRHPRLRQARRHGHRRRDQPRDRPRGGRDALSGRARQRLADFERRGSIVVGDVHPIGGEVAGALTPVPGRRRAADHRDAAEEHRGGRRPCTPA
jgi:methylenetetrahydrofolate dehydrogenase (NADP+) / methenyltetrahydrofolate cyclohydrolase